MPIQYAEIFINLKRKTYSNYFKSLIGNDISFSEDDTIIISFDNGDVSDTREAERKQVLCGSSGGWSHFPNYLYVGSKMLIMNSIIHENDTIKMHFSTIFKNNPKYSKNKGDPSIYNVIYHSQKGVDVFAIVKMKHSNSRFYLAYDDVLFTREDIMNLVDYILLLKTERKNYDGEYTLLTL
jgi:hypothetical protein